MDRPLLAAELLERLPPLSGAIFDFDGTIAHTAFLWNRVDRIFFSRRGIPLPPDVPDELSARGFEAGSVYVKERFGLPESPQAIQDEWNALAGDLYATDVELRPGVREFIGTLRKRGVPTALATTNDPDVLASMAPRVVLEDLFDAVVTGRDVPVTKNHPDIYLEAARRIGASPSSTVVFEDIPAGLQAAGSAGFIPVAVLNTDPYQNRDALSAVTDRVIGGFASGDASDTHQQS